jgi:ribosomal-protein-alanine N-acetyltransferase
MASPTDNGTILTLKKSTVRRYKLTDAQSSSKAANNANVSKFMRNVFPFPYTVADAETWISMCNAKSDVPNYHFAITNPTTGDVIGGIGCTPEKDVQCRSAELGYWISEDYWGKGVMSEVVPAFMEWIFQEVKVRDKDENELGLTRVWASVVDQNEGSMKVLTKAGFLYEGRMRASVWKYGVVMDQHLYAMTREDWEKKQ